MIIVERNAPYNYSVLYIFYSNKNEVSKRKVSITWVNYLWLQCGVLFFLLSKVVRYKSATQRWQIETLLPGSKNYLIIVHLPHFMRLVVNLSQVKYNNETDYTIAGNLTLTRFIQTVTSMHVLRVCNKLSLLISDQQRRTLT